jgi:hypothetical protein
MISILDSMMREPRAFLPQNVSEYVALQLAKKLDDADRVSSYVALVDRHSLSIIVEAFVNSQARQGENRATAFNEELQALTAKGTEK